MILFCMEHRNELCTIHPCHALPISAVAQQCTWPPPGYVQQTGVTCTNNLGQSISAGSYPQGTTVNCNCAGVVVPGVGDCRTGSSTMTCLPSGTWNPPQPAACRCKFLPIGATFLINLSCQTMFEVVYT